MVAIKSLILPAFIFFEGVQSYCIYNQLDDASFYIIHRYENYVPYRKLFKKTLEPGTSECCPYTKRDCSYLLENYYESTFDITFNWRTTRTSEVYSVDCTSGGALIIRGSEENHYAICKSVGGVETNPPFIPRRTSE